MQTVIGEATVDEDQSGVVVFNERPGAIESGRRVTAAILFLIALISAGRANAAMSRPCGWLTTAEIATALGTPVTAVEDVKNLYTGKPKGCRYKTGFLMRSVAIDAYEAPGVAEAKRYVDTSTHQAARLPGRPGRYAPITPVAGIGDQAANVGNALYVRKGAIVFSLLVFYNDQTTTPESFRKAVALGRLALKRL